MIGWIKKRTCRTERGGPARAAQHLALVCALVATAPNPVYAKTIGLNSCLSLWRQTNAAQTNGLDALMAQGAEGARARLSKTQLAQIKTHIDRTERLKFRCRRFVPPPPGADAP